MKEHKDKQYNSDKEIIEQLKIMREIHNLSVSKLLYDYISTNYPHLSDKWKFIKRTSLEVASWPGWKKSACYSQPQ